LSEEGTNALSNLVMEITLPVLIFCQLVKDFSFARYPNWWIFPLISIAITALGLAVGGVFSIFIKGAQQKAQFLSLVAFQNSGYLPLALIAAIFAPQKSQVLFIYLFLFLMGFNLVMFSLGVHIISFHKNKRFELASLFSPPVIAILFSLIFIYLGLGRFVPEVFYKPLRLVGDCTLPLALFVVGAGLAQVRLTHIDKKVVVLLTFGKLIVLPALGLWFVLQFKIPELIALLILIQLAMPSATSLSVIVRHYKKEDFFISQGIFFSHILSLFSIPLFLSLYFALSVLR
jgi:predicted permease